MDIKKAMLKTGALLAFCAFSTASSATVVSISDMVSFNFGSNNISDYSAGTDGMGANIQTVVTDVQTVSLDRFDASLGQLLDVAIWFESDWSLGSVVRSYDPRFLATASGAGYSVSNQAIRLVDPFMAVEQNHEVNMAACNDFGYCGSGMQMLGTFDGQFNLASFGLSDFIGTNALDFSLARTLVADLTYCGPYDQCGLHNKDNQWSGSLHVSYLFDDAPQQEVDVPEPSTLALLGLGLLGIGATRLGRKKA
jgi:hypothetical protein